MTQDRHRELGQIFKREHVDLAIASQQEGASRLSPQKPAPLPTARVAFFV